MDVSDILKKKKKDKKGVKFTLIKITLTKKKNDKMII